MPLDGKVLSWYRLEYSLTATGAGDTTIWGCFGRTKYTPDTVQFDDELLVIINSNTDTASFAADVYLHGSLIATASAGAYHASSTVTVTIKDLLVYNTYLNAGPYLSYSGIDVVIDGVTTSVGAGTATYSAGTGPCYHPIIGSPWEFGINSAAPYYNSFSSVSPGYGTLTLVGGWRFKETSGDSWTALAVTLPPFGAADAGTFAASSIVSCTSTYSGTLNLWIQRRATNPHTSGTGQFPTGSDILSSLTLLPDLTKSVERVSVDYRALWYRAKLPNIRKTDGRNVRTDTTTTDYGGNSDVYAEEAVLLLPVGKAYSVIEDALTPHTYAPCIVGGADKLYLVPDGHYPIGETTQFIFPLDTTSSYSGYLSHADIRALYFNTWACPHWSYYLHWQSWNLDSSPTTPKDYWHKVRSQYIYNSALSVGDQRDTRNSFVLDPLNTESGIEPFWDTYTSSLGWIGASRWITKDVTIKTTYTYTSASSSLWTLTNCTAAYGADIALTATGGATALVAELDLGSYTVAPYQWPHLANEIFVDWTATNISAVRVYLVGSDASSNKKILEVTPGDGYTTKNHTYSRPLGACTKYAGTWAINNGLAVVTDTGADFDATGISSTIMGDAERSEAFGMLAGYTADKLRVEVDLTVTGGCNINYPKLNYTPAVDPQMIVETGQSMSILWQSAPGIRFGQSYYYSSGVLATPIVKGLGLDSVVVNPGDQEGYPNTIIDALCWTRNWIEGKSSTDGLTTELSTLYDTREGQSAQNADSRSLGAILPKTWADGSIHTLDKDTVRVALVCTQAEIPPIAWMPRRQRTTTGTWAETGSYAQTVYSWAQERRDFVSAGAIPLHLQDGSGNQWTSVKSGSLAGWSLTCHSHEVTNSESGYKLFYNGSQRGKDIRPWHGYFFVDGSGSSAGANVTNWSSQFGHYFRAYISGQDVRFASWPWVPLGSATVASVITTVATGTPRHPAGWQDTRERLYVQYEVENPASTWTIYETHSDDGGVTWSTPGAI